MHESDAIITRTVDPSRRSCRRKSARGVALACLFMPAIAGCAPTTIELTDVSQMPASVDRYDDRSWEKVLRENIKNGLVDYGHLADHRRPLDDYLQILAGCGPESTPDLFPSPASRTAYYINAYNAGVLAAVLRAGVPASIHDVSLPRLEQDYRIMVDRRLRTLDDIRRAAIAASNDDARVLFGMCDAAMSSPPLRDVPYRAEILDEQLRQAAAAAMENERIVFVDHERQAMALGPVIHLHRALLLGYYQKQLGVGRASMLSVLLHLANGPFRDWLNRGVGYAERLLPFDRRLNGWQPFVEN